MLYCVIIYGFLTRDAQDLKLPLIWLKIPGYYDNWFKNYLLELTAIYFMQFRGKTGFPNTKISRFLLRISTRVYGISAGVGPLGYFFIILKEVYRVLP